MSGKTKTILAVLLAALIILITGSVFWGIAVPVALLAADLAVFCYRDAIEMAAERERWNKIKVMTNEEAREFWNGPEDTRAAILAGIQLER